MLFQILMYVLMIYMIYRMFSTTKTVNRRRSVISVIQKIENRDEFMQAADDLIATANNPGIEAKTRVIRIWGEIFHKEFDNIEKELEELNLDPLFIDRKGVLTIEADEDTFFYFLLAIPNMLYGNDQNELRLKFEEKAKLYETKLEGQLIKAVADNCNLYYDGKDDLGEAFFKNVDEGEYPGFRYSKQMIGIYKNICDTMLCRILADRGEENESYTMYTKEFAKTGVGNRFIRMLKLDIKPDEEKTENAAENEEADAAEEAEVTEAAEETAETEASEENTAEETTETDTETNKEESE